MPVTDWDRIHLSLILVSMWFHRLEGQPMKEFPDFSIWWYHLDSGQLLQWELGHNQGEK